VIHHPAERLCPPLLSGPLWDTEKRSYTFDKPGVVPLLCNVHPEMAAYVVVSPTPYFAETDEAGNYKIKDVPDGSYTVTAWHEGAKNQSKL